MLTKSERDKKRALNDARRAGKILPEIDQNGNVINPHVPEFMANAPWYLGQHDGKGLAHQKKIIKADEATAKIGTWLKRGKETLVTSSSSKEESNNNNGTNSSSSSSKPLLSSGAAISSSKAIIKKSADGNDQTKRDWKIGCKNCGSRTHKEKECLERPRKIGAWKTGKDIQPDDAQQIKLKFDYEGARDRYNGFDPSQQLRTIMIHEMAEKERKKRKREEKKAKKKKEKLEKAKEKSTSDSKSSSDSSSGSSSSSSSDDDSSSSESETNDKVAPIVPAGVRVRSDTAKYLYNLELDSAFYDPKTRSMRGNPFPESDPSSLIFAGDNFVKQSSEAVIDTSKFPL